MTRLPGWSPWVAAMAILTLVGCGSAAAQPTASRPSHVAAVPSAPPSISTYVIPTILSLSGSAAFLGREEQQSLTAFQSDVNAHGGIDGHPVQFDIVNNDSNPATAVSLASRFLAQHYPILLNGSVVPTDIAVDKLAGTAGPVIYDLSPGVHPPAHSFIFGAGTSAGQQIQAFFNYLLGHHLTRIAVISSNDASGQDGWLEMKRLLQSSQFRGKLTLLTHQTYSDTAISVSSQLTRIAATHPQALIAWATGTPIETVFKGLPAAGLTSTPVFTTDGNASEKELQRLKAVLPKALYFPSPQFFSVKYLTGANRRAVINFYRAFARIHVAPASGNALSWDPARIVVHVIRTLGVHATALQIRNAIQNLRGFAGADGIYGFSPTNHRGIALSGTWVTRWHPSQNTWIPVSGPKGLGRP